MDLKQLEAFAAVVKYKSYTKAAQKLFLTQPTVSAHIKSLEEELGKQLIIRSTKSVAPSADGKVLYEYAVDMLNLRDSALEHFSAVRCADEGAVSICASTVPARYILPKLMASFIIENPDITFDVQNSDSAGVAAAVSEQRAELGFLGARVDASRCMFSSFADDDLIVITANVPPYSDMGSSIEPETAANAKWIMREEGSGTRIETERALIACGIDPEGLNVAACVTDPEQVTRLVSMNAGISVISRCAAKELLDKGRLRAFTLGDPMKRKLYVAYSRSRPLSGAAKQFLKFVREYQKGE